MDNINIQTDSGIKVQYETMFENPSMLTADVPNQTTLAAFREGDEILADDSVEGYSNIKGLKTALEVWSAKLNSCNG